MNLKAAKEDQKDAKEDLREDDPMSLKDMKHL